ASDSKPDKPCIKLNSHILEPAADRAIIFYYMDPEENIYKADSGSFKLYDQLGNLLLDWQMGSQSLDSGTFTWNGAGVNTARPGIYLFMIKFDNTKLTGSIVVKPE
ncbi:MAG TPA: hypothetical protein VKS21_13220, partial [Spirochaetota bacterium]|nr:hypothetical protein [Spirochaetota bacterium]